jgi:hypothetical protein
MLVMVVTWNDLTDPLTRWLGLPALAAMRRDYLGAISEQQRFGDLVRQRTVNERSVDVFDPEFLRQLMFYYADALIRWARGSEVFSEGSGQSVLVTEGAVWQRQRHMLVQASRPSAWRRWLSHAHGVKRSASQTPRFSATHP